MSSNVLFCSKPQNVQFTITLDEEKQQILTFPNLEPSNMSAWNITWAADTFSIVEFWLND